MKTTKKAKLIINRLDEVLSQINDEQIDLLISQINTANRVFISGAGRSRLMAAAFVMRLMHAGFEAYLVGEVVTPAICKGDLLLVCSGSGETASQISNAKKAKEIGAKVALITTRLLSTIGRISDCNVEIHVVTEKDPSKKVVKDIQPGGSTFEQSLFLLLESVYLNILEDKNITVDIMKRHANLE